MFDPSTVRIGGRGTRIARGAAWKVRHIIESSLLERPRAVRRDCQWRGDLSVSRDHVTARLQWEVGLLHDEAVLLEPPVITVKFPSRWRDAAIRLEACVVGKTHTARTWINSPNAPALRATALGGRRISKRRNKLSLNPPPAAHCRPGRVDLDLRCE